MFAQADSEILGHSAVVPIGSRQRSCDWWGYPSLDFISTYFLSSIVIFEIFADFFGRRYRCKMGRTCASPGRF